MSLLSLPMLHIAIQEILEASTEISRHELANLVPRVEGGALNFL
jgi:hypothetical protein